MKDLSEIPGGTEQAKPTRARPAARPKADHAAPVSQEQETKSAPRRRNTSTSHTSTGTTAAQQSGNEHAVPAPQQSASESATPTPQQSGNENVAPAPRPAGAPQGNAPTQTRSGASHRNVNNGSAPRSRSGAPASQRGDGAPSSHRGDSTAPGAPRPPAGPRGASSGPQNRYQGGQYGGPGAGPRPGGPGAGPRPGGPGAGPRPGGPGAGQRPGGPGAGQRFGGPGGGQRSGGPNGQGAGTHAPSQRPAQRPGGGGRPGGQRGGGRSGGQRGSSATRTQERRAAQVKEKPTGPVSLPPQIVVKDLAEALSTSAIEIIRNLIKHGVFASINQVVDYEQAALVAQDLGFEPSPVAASTAPAVRGTSASAALADNDAHAIEIPPVVTIMGHVDHGKTSLLDMIRKTKVAAGEAGGITQHIGAYQVEINGKKITFLDTPGHEAFTAMRARGAQVAHIAIIVIAADDGIMPQTREAIDHAQAAKMPIIIALNKVDKPNANPDRVKQQLADIGLLIEEYGGQTVCVPVSAKKGLGIDELLEYILLVAEVQDIRANLNRSATGIIIEARLEKSSGATATVLVQQGTLTMGDNIVVGAISGKIRAMTNDRGKRIMKAGPSTPVSILGLPEVPQAGDRLEVVPDERTAKQRATQEAEKRRSEAGPLGQVSLDTLYMQMQEGKVKELALVLKTDVQGSSEAIKGSLSKLGEENLKVRLIREGVGNISETDVHLAAASGAIIIAFNVNTDGAALREAQKEGVDIRHYNVIYKLIEDIEAALKGMLEPTYREVIDGNAEILQTFKAGKTIIAGCRVTSGKIVRSSQVRILRKDEKVFEGKMASLRRGKDDVREVLSGYECGILFEDFNGFEVGDIVEAFSQERVQPGA